MTSYTDSDIGHWEVKEDIVQEKPRRCCLQENSVALDPDVSFNLKARRCQEWLWPRTGGPGPALAVSQYIGRSLRLGTSFVILPNGRAHWVDRGAACMSPVSGTVAQHFLIEYSVHKHVRAHVRMHTCSLRLKIHPLKSAHSLPARVCYLTLHRSPLPSRHISAAGGGDAHLFRNLSKKRGGAN